MVVRLMSLFEYQCHISVAGLRYIKPAGRRVNRSPFHPSSTTTSEDCGFITFARLSHRSDSKTMERGHNDMTYVALLQWILAMGGQIHYIKLKSVVEAGLSKFETESDLESISALFCAFPRGVEYQKEVAFLMKCLNKLRARSEFVLGYESEAELRLRDIIETLIFYPAGAQSQVHTGIATDITVGLMSPGISSHRSPSPSSIMGICDEDLSYRPRYYKFGAFQSPPTDVKYLPHPRFL